MWIWIGILCKQERAGTRRLCWWWGASVACSAGGRGISSAREVLLVFHPRLLPPPPSRLPALSPQLQHNDDKYSRRGFSKVVRVISSLIRFPSFFSFLKHSWDPMWVEVFYVEIKATRWPESRGCSTKKQINITQIYVPLESWWRSCVTVWFIKILL